MSSVKNLATQAAENEVANKLVEDLLENNPELVEQIMEENLRVLVIFALKNPELFEKLLEGETDKKMIV